MNWKKLQNGSDIRGVALEGVPGEAVNLTPDVAQVLGKSFISWLLHNGASQVSVAVGTDSRISGPVLNKPLLRVCVKPALRCTIADWPPRRPCL